MIISELSLPIPYNPSMDVQDSTKIQCAQDCARLYFFEYVLGWRSIYPNNHLHFGKCLHLAMEHIILHGYTVNSVVEGLQLFNDEYRMEFPESTDSVFLPKTPGNFLDMLVGSKKVQTEGYLRKYASDPLKYSVYKTEFGGTVTLSPTHKLAFKMDTILQNTETGKYGSLEHKSKGGNYIGDNFAIEHAMGIQCGTYTHVLNTLFPPADVEGVTINCLCFKKTKTFDWILQRFPIFLSDLQMYIWLENTKAWMDSIWRDFQALSETKESDDIMVCFKKNGRNCTNWGRTCGYYDICNTYANPIQAQHRMPADMRIDFWNPLEEELREKLDL